MKYILVLLTFQPITCVFAQVSEFDTKLDSFLILYHELEPQIEPEVVFFENVVSKMETLTTDYTEEETEFLNNLDPFKLAYSRMAFLNRDFGEFIKNSPVLADPWLLEQVYLYKKKMHDITFGSYEKRVECSLCRFFAVTMPEQEDKNPNCAACFEEPTIIPTETGQ